MRHSDVQGGEVAAGAVAPAFFVSHGAWRRSDAPDCRLVHPSTGLLSPLFFVLGAALPEDRASPVFEGFNHARSSLRSLALRG